MVGDHQPTVEVELGRVRCVGLAESGPAETCRNFPLRNLAWTEVMASNWISWRTARFRNCEIRKCKRN